MSNKQVWTRLQMKNDTSTNWDIASQKGFIPLLGEPIFYKNENGDIYGMKVGNGVNTPNELAFIGGEETASTQITHNGEYLYDILETYIFNIDYDTLLAFDTTEIVVGNTTTTSVLGQAILGQMILA